MPLEISTALAPDGDATRFLELLGNIKERRVIFVGQSRPSASSC
jgi:hypothetical protein